MQSERKIETDVAVLVDVDKTLLLGIDGSYNVDLIRALVNSGHKQIFLFTSMSMREIVDELANSGSSSRPKLVGKLKQEGIDVVSVLTPADVAYNKGIGACYQELFLKHHQRIGRDLTVENYKDDEEFTTDRAIYDSCHLASGKAEGSATEKSKLFEYFLAKKPAGLTSFVVIDDQNHHLKAIAEIKESAANLTCIQVNKDSNQSYFEAMLQTHNIKRPRTILPSLLQEEKSDTKTIRSYIDDFYKRGKICMEQNNFDGACRYFEMIYLMKSFVKMLVEETNAVLKLLNNARKNAKTAGMTFVDNTEIDSLYQAIVNTNALVMRIKKIQLNIELFRENYDTPTQKAGLLFSVKNPNREQDFERSILNPLAVLISEQPQLREDGLKLLKHTQSLIPNALYQNGIQKLEQAAAMSKQHSTAERNAFSANRKA